MKRKLISSAGGEKKKTIKKSQFVLCSLLLCSFVMPSSHPHGSGCALHNNNKRVRKWKNFLPLHIFSQHAIIFHFEVCIVQNNLTRQCVCFVLYKSYFIYTEKVEIGEDQRNCLTHKTISIIQFSFFVIFSWKFSVLVKMFKEWS